MYSNKLVMSVLVDGTPSRELNNGTVPIPFNSEYVIRLRNKNTRRVVAKVFVDGDNVAEGGIIIPAGGYVDLEAPIGLHKRFKFVSLDSPDAVDFGKNGPNHDKTKGLIEAHFHFEKEQPKVEEHHHHHHHHDYPWWPRPWRPPYDWSDSARMKVRGMSANFSAGGLKETLDTDSYGCAQAMPMMGQPICAAPDKLLDGCTVEGSYTGQTFRTSHMDYEENATVLKIFLQGFDAPDVVVSANSGRKKVRRQAETEEAPLLGDVELDNLRQKRLALEKAMELKRIAELEKALAETATT